MVKIKFLKFCLFNSVTPQYLVGMYKCKFKFAHPSSNKKYSKARDTYNINKILNIELNDAFRSIFLEHKLSNYLDFALPAHIYDFSINRAFI